MKTRQHVLIFPPSPPGGHAVVSSVAPCCVRPTAHAIVCIVSGDDSAVFRFFVPGDLDQRRIKVFGGPRLDTITHFPSIPKGG